MTIARRSSHNNSNGSLTALNQSTLLRCPSPRRTPKFLASPSLTKRKSVVSAPNLLRSIALGSSGKNGDRLQSADKRRRYMRRGSKTSCMLKIPKNLASLECIARYSPTGDYSSSSSSAEFSLSSSQSSATMEAQIASCSEDLVSLALSEARKVVHDRQESNRPISVAEAAASRRSLQAFPPRIGRGSDGNGSLANRSTTMSLLTSALALSSVHDADDLDDISIGK